MWPTSNGYSYTDSNFKCNLPALCDEQGNIVDSITNFYQDQTACCCDICSAALSEDKLTDPNTILPVVVEGPDNRDPDALYAIWPENHELEGVRRTCQAAAHILVSLCKQCQSRAFAIMETSDHAAIGSKHWPLLVANLRKQLTDPGWDKYDNQKAQERLHRRIAKKLVILSTPQPIPAQQPAQQPSQQPAQQPASITELPDDVFGIIGKYLVTAEKHRLATLIQTLYRSWRESSKHPSRQWSHPQNRDLTRTQAAAKNLWTNCDDCGAHRLVSDTITMDACADHAGCCYKTVCSTYCQYRCNTFLADFNNLADPADPADLTNPHLTCNNIIYVHQDDKNHNGEPTVWRCDSCHFQTTLHEQWWGLSDLEHEARYG